MERDTSHAVWNIYDLFRTVRLNVKYCRGRLAHYQQINFWLEFILACTASSSAIAAFTLWETTAGSVVWRFLGGISAVLAILKPLLKLTEKIRSLEEVLTGYKVMDIDLGKLTAEIRERGEYDDELRKRFREIYDRMDDLVTRFSENREDKKLLKRCQQEVNTELPPEFFPVPNRT